MVLQALRYLIVMKISNVKAMFASNKGKAVTLIIWKTGFGMETAMLVQGRVVRVRPNNMYMRTTTEANYSLTTG